MKSVVTEGKADKEKKASKADFISKNAIALKEAREANYWLRLIISAELMPENNLAALRDEALEIARVIASITVSGKKG